MTPYTSFSQFYDQVMGDGDKSAQDVLRLIERYNPACRAVLELGCGTGAVLRHLRRRYRVAGLDLSPSMLRIAKSKLKGIPLYHKNMTSFRLRERFDAIVCIFDSINHLTKWSDWLRVFRKAHDHLNPGGIFIFDVNTPAKLKELGAAPVWVHAFDGNLLLLDVTCDKKGLSRWNIKVFQAMKKGLYRLHEENIYERAFPLTTIKKGLARIFDKVHVVNLGGTVSPTTPRLHFIARKKVA